MYNKQVSKNESFDQLYFVVEATNDAKLRDHDPTTPSLFEICVQILLKRMDGN